LRTDERSGRPGGSPEYIQMDEAGDLLGRPYDFWGDA